MLSTLLVVSMVFAMQLSHSNYQQATPSKEKLPLFNVEKTVSGDLSIIDSTVEIINSETATSDLDIYKHPVTAASLQASALPQPSINNKSNTAFILLLCTGLVGLVGINRKKH